MDTFQARFEPVVKPYWIEGRLLGIPKPKVTPSSQTAVFARIKALPDKIRALQKRIAQEHQTNEISLRLANIPDIDPM